MDEIRIYLTPDKQNQVLNNIEFETVKAGQTSKRNIYVENVSPYFMKVDVKLTGEDIDLSESIDSLSPNEMREIQFELSPSMTAMKPIVAELTIKIKYVVR